MVAERRTIGMVLVGLGLVVAGCGPSSEVKEQLAQLAALSAEKDSLLAQVSENARLMSEISAELARVQKPAVGAQEGGAAPASPEAILASIKDLTARLEQSEARLLESEKRIASLTRQAGQAVELRRTIANLRSTIENQKETIASLTAQVESLKAENTRLASENQALTEQNVTLTQTVTELTTRENTVYYVIGTKDELKERGLITEEGGSRFPFLFAKTGKALVPARNLDPSLFTAADKRQLLELALPAPDKTYRIVTRQDLSALAEPADEGGRIRGGVLRIADPEKFWANTRFLIIVES